MFNNNNAKIAVIAVAAWYTGGLVQSALFNSMAGSAAAAAAGAGATLTTTQVGAMYAASMAAGGATAGFTSGFLASGGDINAGMKGALNGAISGGIFGGVSTYASLNNFNMFQRIGANALAGGVTASLQGGSFADGFRYAASSGILSESYTKFVGYSVDASPGEGVAEKGINGRPLKGFINIGDQTGNVLKPCFSCEGGPLSTFANLIPGVNAVSGFHDNIVIGFKAGSIMRDYIMNVPTMPLAAAVTYGALANDPLFQASVSNAR